MRKKSVALVELHVFEKITPLASGYLQAYATADPDVGAAHTFHIYSNTVMAPLNEVAGEVVALDADVYAFSCYVWNMGMLRALVKQVREAKPRAHVMLSGPQVMHTGTSTPPTSWRRGATVRASRRSPNICASSASWNPTCPGSRASASCGTGSR
jgi:hypothetical protein